MLNYFKTFSIWRTAPTQIDIENAEKKIFSNLKTEYEQKFIDIGNGQVINTIKIGDKGEPIVLVHGFGAGIGLWCCNLDFLSKYYTVYAIDLIGFGRSSRPDPEQIKTLDEAENTWTESINEWSKKVGLDKFHLVGHSLGGYVSACYALKYPNKVNTLLLCDPWGLPARPIDFEENLTMPKRLISKYLSIDASLSIVRKMGPKLVSKFRRDLLMKFQHVFPIEPTDNTENIISDYIYHSNSLEPASGEHLFRMVSLPFGYASSPLFERMKQIDSNVNISFIYGEHSWIDPTPGFLLQKEMKNIKNIHMLSRSGHHVYIDNLDEFHNSILNSIPISNDLKDLFNNNNNNNNILFSNTVNNTISNLNLNTTTKSNETIITQSAST
ncbi:hypothetical protein DICPUDRAFT_49330 [Dictyostelium purpureum]|uniref:AB hydrolase-1 domain-containing protein n=1 Tax=Dictyostelium purpureum TaxID=5786 RepID=F0ZTB1_DICPU|nr:uncharacterized protein DICPUDRAFT_49330 [Dictyostelium purpureum]EGC32826.1 hypothetical protein DICPUDRAFT_49330 [Dictyostelium purpureum]|eukprot:XP_003290649.1 hypothetical protein DICPUDRAFT_49330 [Dictyostelium purpureum]